MTYHLRVHVRTAVDDALKRHRDTAVGGTDLLHGGGLDLGGRRVQGDDGREKDREGKSELHGVKRALSANKDCELGGREGLGRDGDSESKCKHEIRDRSSRKRPCLDVEPERKEGEAKGEGKSVRETRKALRGRPFYDAGASSACAPAQRGRHSVVEQ